MTVYLMYTDGSQCGEIVRNEHILRKVENSTEHEDDESVI